MLSDPPPSLSMSSKQRAAAVRKLSVNSSISFCAAFACTARAAARASSLAARADSIASCLRCYRPVSRETRRPSRGHGDGVLLRHQHAIAASKAPQSFRLRNAPLALVDVAVAVRVHLLERRLEARRHEQVLEVRVAAVDEELDDALVALDSCDAAGESSGE